MGKMNHNFSRFWVLASATTMYCGENDKNQFIRSNFMKNDNIMDFGKDFGKEFGKDFSKD